MSWQAEELSECEVRFGLARSIVGMTARHNGSGPIVRQLLPRLGAQRFMQRHERHRATTCQNCHRANLHEATAGQYLDTGERLHATVWARA